MSLIVLGLFLIHVAEHALLQHFGETDDRVQRRPQLVRHVGEEFGLVAVGDFKLLALFPISLNNRTFSIAITAWSANVSSSVICFSAKAHTSERRTVIEPIGVPSFNNGTVSIVWCSGTPEPAPNFSMSCHVAG